MPGQNPQTDCDPGKRIQRRMRRQTPCRLSATIQKWGAYGVAHPALVFPQASAARPTDSSAARTGEVYEAQRAMACCASRERGNRASARLSMSARFAIPRSTTWYPLGREVTGNFLARVCCLAEEIQFGWRATSTAYVIRDGVELHTCLINTPHCTLGPFGQVFFCPPSCNFLRFLTQICNFSPRYFP
ncbi:MAG: hypothetical protein ACI89E_002256 [Planctomycetota bacterium]